jgi:hypothetical protein
LGSINIRALATVACSLAVMLVLVVPAFSPSAAASKPAVYTLAAAGDIGMDSLRRRTCSRPSTHRSVR